MSDCSRQPTSPGSRRFERSEAVPWGTTSYYRRVRAKSALGDFSSSLHASVGGRHITTQAWRGYRKNRLIFQYPLRGRGSSGEMLEAV